jgi:serine/threonine-protein kinase
MPLDPADLGPLSRLLDQALALDPAGVEVWLAALPAQQRYLAPTLRAMLSDYRSPQYASFLIDGPRLAQHGPEDNACRVGDVLGAYALIRLLGRGGMGSVWLAERSDGLVKRPAALKVAAVSLTSAASVERFVRERDVLAMLNHPLIARLYDAGVSASGLPYIVLEYVDGLPITQACDAQAMPLAARLRIFLQVLDAVDHAHKHLVVHRDIKPSNVFVDREGRVKLLDFGIAKLMTEASDAQGASALTLEAGCALTPSHAAPEQLDGRPVSTLTDVYALGILLYELLCGCLPHPGVAGSLAQALHASLHDAPTAPSRAVLASDAASRRGLADAAGLRSLLAGDLDVLVLKAMAKQPADRYSSVERFADDIRRFLDQRPIVARRPSLQRRLQLFMQRNRAVSVTAGLGLAAAVGLSAVAWQQQLQTREQEARSVAVRDFMFDLVDDAETDEKHPGSEPTGRAMVAGAVQRARDSFAPQPRLRGELLAELGRMQQRLGEDNESDRVLQEALALLQANAPDGDASLNKARTYLAATQLRQGRVDAAATLASAALAACQRGNDCLKARYYANAVLCGVELRRGHVAQALQQMRDGVAHSELAFGPRHPETARALQALAVVARQASQFDLALQTIDRALAISQTQTLRLADRIEMLRTRAVLSFDLGDYVDAQRRLESLLPQAAVAGERALLWRLLANVHLALGHAAQARDAADEALRQVEPSEQDVERLFAHQAHARALALLGQTKAADEELRTVAAGLRDAGYSEQAMEVLRARRFLAEVQLRAGQLDTGLALLTAVRNDQARAMAGQEVEYAQTLDLLGCALQLTGDAKAGLAAHREAAGLLAARLHADHPLLQRNARLEQAGGCAPMS